MLTNTEMKFKGLKQTLSIDLLIEMANSNMETLHLIRVRLSINHSGRTSTRYLMQNICITHHSTQLREHSKDFTILMSWTIISTQQAARKKIANKTSEEHTSSNGRIKTLPHIK